MHGQAKCSDRFLWAVIKVCKILLRFFLAGFQYCLFKLELGWYSSFLLSLPELVIPLHKSPGAVAFIQHGLVTPWEATPSPLLELWYDSVQKWLNRLNSSSFPLSLLLTPTCMHTCVHVLRQMHALGFLLSRNEKGELYSTVSWKVPFPWNGDLWAQYSERDTTLFFHQSGRCPEFSSNFLLPNFVLWYCPALLNLSHFVKHPMLFLAPDFALMGPSFLLPILMNSGLPCRSQLGWASLVAKG